MPIVTTHLHFGSSTNSDYTHTLIQPLQPLSLQYNNIISSHSPIVEYAYTIIQTPTSTVYIICITLLSHHPTTFHKKKHTLSALYSDVSPPTPPSIPFHILHSVDNANPSLSKHPPIPTNNLPRLNHSPTHLC